MRCLHLVVRSLDPTGKGAASRMNRRKPGLNAFAIAFEGRTFPSRSLTAGDGLHDEAGPT